MKKKPKVIRKWPIKQTDHLQGNTSSMARISDEPLIAQPKYIWPVKSAGKERESMQLTIRAKISKLITFVQIH